MKRPRRDIWAPPPEFESIAAFGGAQILKSLDGKLTIRGGTDAEQAQARDWMARFLSSAGLGHRPPVSNR